MILLGSKEFSEQAAKEFEEILKKNLKHAVEQKRKEQQKRDEYRKSMHEAMQPDFDNAFINALMDEKKAIECKEKQKRDEEYIKREQLKDKWRAF